MNDISVDLEFTPNPNSLKYVTHPPLMEKGAANFSEASAAEGKSILAETLFKIDGIVGVMIARNFVSITLENHERLTIINDEVIDAIKDHIRSGKAAIDLEALNQHKNTGDLGDVEKMIVDILDAEIRPAVAMDGGDITFDRY